MFLYEYNFIVNLLLKKFYNTQRLDGGRDTNIIILYYAYLLAFFRQFIRVL